MCTSSPSEPRGAGRLSLIRVRLTSLALVRKGRLHGDLDVALEGLGDRAILARISCGILKGRLVQSRDAAADGEARSLDSLARDEADHGRGFYLLGGVAALGEDVGERHAEASRVGSGKQLLGAGRAGGALGARGPADLEVGEDAAGDACGPAAAGQVAVPYCCRIALCSHSILLG